VSLGRRTQAAKQGHATAARLLAECRPGLLPARNRAGRTPLDEATRAGGGGRAGARAGGAGGAEGDTGWSGAAECAALLTRSWDALQALQVSPFDDDCLVNETSGGVATGSDSASSAKGKGKGKAKGKKKIKKAKHRPPVTGPPPAACGLKPQAAVTPAAADSPDPPPAPAAAGASAPPAPDTAPAAAPGGAAPPAFQTEPPRQAAGGEGGGAGQAEAEAAAAAAAAAAVAAAVAVAAAAMPAPAELPLTGVCLPIGGVTATGLPKSKWMGRQLSFKQAAVHVFLPPSRMRRGHTTELRRKRWAKTQNGTLVPRLGSCHAGSRRCQIRTATQAALVRAGRGVMTRTRTRTRRNGSRAACGRVFMALSQSTAGPRCASRTRLASLDPPWVHGCVARRTAGRRA
jgi:hypothetical protein